MSTIFCKHGEYTHPWDCYICEDLANAEAGDILNNPRDLEPDEPIPTLTEIFRWED